MHRVCLFIFSSAIKDGAQITDTGERVRMLAAEHLLIPL
jgi:hypothetical protein